MSELSDYLMTHHLSAMSNECNGNVEAAALEVIKAQDAELARIKFTPDGTSDWESMSELEQWIERYNFMRVRGDDAIQQLYKLRHPTPPAQAGEHK